MEPRCKFGSELPAGNEKIETNYLNIEIIQCSGIFASLLIVREYRKSHVNTHVLIRKKKENIIINPIQYFNVGWEQSARKVVIKGAEVTQHQLILT